MKIDITTAAMLGTLNISVWEARRQDKNTAAEVTAQKGARSKRAATVHKHLLSECSALEAIKSLRSEARVWFNNHTLPWDDNGRRIVPVARYMDVTDEAAKFAARFDALVNAFCNTYSSEISAQAFKMGALFDRGEYPPVDEVRAKFRFNFVVEPMPVAGDFRVDIGNEAARQLHEQYEKAMEQRVSAAVSDAWQRVKDQVVWVHERMTAVLNFNPDDPQTVEDEEGSPDASDGAAPKKRRRPKLYDSMLEQGLALTGLLRDLNVTNDPRLEEARHDLEKALSRIDMDSLRESPELQRSTQTAMQSIIDKFAL